MRLSKRIIQLFLLLFFVSCSNITPPISQAVDSEQEESPIFAKLPNFVFEVDGTLELRRIGWVDYYPVSFGTILQPGDLVRLSEAGNAVVFCGDVSSWDSSPFMIEADGKSHGNPCKVDSRSHEWPDLASMRGGESALVPYVLYPRNTAVMNGTPKLGWNAVHNSEAYSITVLSDDGVDREKIFSDKSEIDWPSTWPPMEPGSTYVLRVRSGDRELAESKIGIGFWLLPVKKIEEVEDQLQQINKLNLSSVAIDRLKAEIYLNNGLRSNAMEILNELSEIHNFASTWMSIGQIYLDIGLGTEAFTSFEKALKVANSTGELEIEAYALLGLGMSSMLLNENEAGQEYLINAKEIFQNIGHQQGLDRVADFLNYN